MRCLQSRADSVSSRKHSNLPHFLGSSGATEIASKKGVSSLELGGRLLEAEPDKKRHALRSNTYALGYPGNYWNKLHVDDFGCWGYGGEKR
jgi:hypothetical protein